MKMENKQTFNVWCLDDGYGDNKCVTANKSILVPSSYSEFKNMTKNDFEQKTINQLDYISVQYDNEKYVVGKFAMKKDVNNQWFGGENKHLDNSFPVFTNTCFGLMADKPFEVVDCLVMGLPVESELNNSRHEYLKNNIVKQHSMSIGLADGTKFSRDVLIKNLIVKKQPFGSVCDLMLNENGDIENEEIARGFNVVVDIGSRTLNVYTLDTLEPIDDLCFHTNNGMYTAYMMVGEYIKKEIGYSIPSGKLPLYIHSNTFRDLDISPIVNRSYEILAYEIYKIIETKFVNSWVFIDRIIFTGGGSELLKGWLSYLFKNKEIVFMDRFSNARGLRKYGVRYMKKQMENKSSVEVKVGNNVQYY